MALSVLSLSGVKPAPDDGGIDNSKESYCRSLRDGLALDTAMKHNTAV
jgi:hypothetical protein